MKNEADTLSVEVYVTIIFYNRNTEPYRGFPLYGLITNTMYVLTPMMASFFLQIPIGDYDPQ